MTPDQLAQLLDELGKRLGPAGEQLFRLAVQRQIISGVLSLVVGGAILLTCSVAARVIWRWAKAPDQDPYSDRDLSVGIAGFALFCVASVGAMALYYGLLTLLTPEFSAIKEILQSVSGR